ncbi:MAG: hypothetical protein L6Q35_04170, partial [Phycisphaerales bacterium]|nr:hypothetical protein [Phycisphaerales bacterium]
NERVRPVLEGFARDENDPRRAQEARDILDAWEESIALISHLWEARHEQRAARTAEESDPPEPGETPADECEQPE